jgi:hypothetical protein
MKQEFKKEFGDDVENFKIPDVKNIFRAEEMEADRLTLLSVACDRRLVRMFRGMCKILDFPQKQGLDAALKLFIQHYEADVRHWEKLG